MNRSIRHTFLTATTACGLWLAPATAQTTATTDPVGAMSFTIPDQTDFRLGVPLTRGVSYDGVVESVVGSSVSVGESVGDLTTAPHFLLVTSGASVGTWSSVIGVSGNSIELEEALSGVVAGDQIEAHQFWTLGNIFPNGIDPNFVSTNALSPNGFVLTNDLNQGGVNTSPTGVYFYYSDGGQNDGWYENGSFAAANEKVLSPETFFTVRNQSGVAIEVTNTGSVLTTPLSVRVVGSASEARDNKVPVSVPTDVKLSDLNLVSSGAIAPSSDALRPNDFLLVYDQQQTGINTSPSGVYFYYTDGGENDGWYQNGSFEPSDSVTVPGGGALIIRKGASADSVYEWAIPVNY